MCHMVYVGLLAASDWWHSSGVKGPQVLDVPVGRPLMRSLDHLTLAWVGGGGGLTAAAYELVKAYAMVLAASLLPPRWQPDFT